MEQIILEIITKSAEEKVIRSPQHNFTKGKSCSTDLIALVMAGQDGLMRGEQWLLSTLTSARLLSLSHNIIFSNLIPSDVHLQTEMFQSSWNKLCEDRRHFRML